MKPNYSENMFSNFFNSIFAIKSSKLRKISAKKIEIFLRMPDLLNLFMFLRPEHSVLLVQQPAILVPRQMVRKIGFDF